jgi:hypothetical protein
MERIVRASVVSKGLTSTDARFSNVTISSLYTDNLNVRGDLFVNGSFTTINVKEINCIQNNISTGSISVSGISSFQNIISNKLKASCVLASSSIGIGTLLPSSTLDIKNDSIVSINLQNNSSCPSRTKIYSYDDGNTYIQSSGDIYYTNINSTLLRNMCLKVDGKVGIGTTCPSATLDVSGNANFSIGITTSSLYIPTTGDNPIIDTNLYNHLMIYEDFLENSLRSNAITLGNVLYSQYLGGTTGYLELTQNEPVQSGSVYWNLNIGNAFTLTFDHYAGGGNGADEIIFSWAGTTCDNGYQISFNEYANTIELLYNNQRMAYYPISSLDNSEWHTSTIIFYRNIIRVIHDGNQVLAHLDTSRNLSNKNYIGFKGRSGGNTNYHRIKNIRLSKFSEGLWTYQSTTSSNIIYNSGSVGIGTMSPSSTLHIVADPSIDKILRIDSSEESSCFYKCSNLLDANSGMAAMKIGRNVSNSRSINASGSINGTGADYAAYIKKSESCGIINKGDICGINENCELTDIYDESIHFVIKSTNPSFIGGDNWGGLDKCGKYPELNNFENKEDFLFALSNWNTEFEIARSKVDRIAFCGIVPINIYNPTIGHYIIPTRKSDGKIKGTSISKNELTFEQYRIAIGIITKIVNNETYIIVKIV